MTITLKSENNEQETKTLCPLPAGAPLERHHLSGCLSAFLETKKIKGTMKEKDSMLFPITDIFDLAETLANLSDEGLNTLKTSLANDYGINLELKKEL